MSNKRKKLRNFPKLFAVWTGMELKKVKRRNKIKIRHIDKCLEIFKIFIMQ